MDTLNEVCRFINNTPWALGTVCFIAAFIGSIIGSSISNQMRK